MRGSTKDILAAAATLGIVAAFYAQTGELDGISLYFPRMLFIFLTAGSVILLLNALRKMRTEQKESGDEAVSLPRVAIIALGSIGYVAIIPLLGFYPASLVFLVLMGLLLRDKSAGMKKALLTTALFTLVLCFCVWGGFSWLLNVPTPESVLFQN